MGAFEHQIEELVAFARDRDNNDRSVLFCELTDLFTSGTAPIAAEDREHLLDVIEALVPHVSPNTRSGVAAQLADMHHPPMDLVMRLIYDDADLVANLITTAPMDEDSLIEFIAKTGRAHHQELATRTDLSANIWIALARAAPTMPMNRLHNESALWDDDLGKCHRQDSEAPNKNAEELGIDLFMTRPAPEEKIKIRPPTRPPLTVINSGQKSQSASAMKTAESPDVSAENPYPESDIFLENNIAANDLTKNTLSRKERRELDQHVQHPLPRATVDIDNFNWDQHVNVDLGWALLTSREGQIADLSQSARTFMGLAAERLIGMDIVELIGLTDRPDHPVVRALSRHGAIHDAPVVLFVGPVGRASWTLSAVPQFENKSGLFEGFNCHFSPVAVSDEDIPVFLDEIDDDSDYKPHSRAKIFDNNITSITGEVPIISETPLFLDDDFNDDPGDDAVPLTSDPDVTEALAEAVARNMDMDIDTIREQAKEMARERMAEIQSRLKGNDIKQWPKIITEATGQTNDPNTDDHARQNPLNQIFDPAPTMAAEKTEAPTKALSPSAEPRIIADPATKVKPAAPAAKKANPQQDALCELVEASKLAKDAIEDEEHIHQTHLQRMATIKHMLAMMEDAGERLKGNHPGDDPLTIQLDADIAKTCAKALRELLANKLEK